MSFKNNDISGWMRHSLNLQFNNKAIRLDKTEYLRTYSELQKQKKFLNIYKFSQLFVMRSVMEQTMLLMLLDLLLLFGLFINQEEN